MNRCTKRALELKQIRNETAVINSSSQQTKKWIRADPPFTTRTKDIQAAKTTGAKTTNICRANQHISLWNLSNIITKPAKNGRITMIPQQRRKLRRVESLRNARRNGKEQTNNIDTSATTT
jgi:hypothetical protein